MKDKHDKQTIDAFKPQPMTNAERQRKYRAEKKAKRGYDGGAERLDTYISSETAVKLKTLIVYFEKLQGNETKKELIERLINEEYMKHVNDFPPNLF